MMNRAFYETDLSEVYAAVRAPTLVLYRDTFPPTPEESRGVAALIPQAHAMRVFGSDYWVVFLSLEIVDQLERLSAGETAPTIPESVLTTLLLHGHRRIEPARDRGRRSRLAGPPGEAPRLGAA